MWSWRQTRKVHVSGMENKVDGSNQKTTTKGRWTSLHSKCLRASFSFLYLDNTGTFGQHGETEKLRIRQILWIDYGFRDKNRKEETAGYIR